MLSHLPPNTYHLTLNTYHLVTVDYPNLFIQLLLQMKGHEWLGALIEG